MFMVMLGFRCVGRVKFLVMFKVTVKECDTNECMHYESMFGVNHVHGHVQGRVHGDVSMFLGVVMFVVIFMVMFKIMVKECTQMNAAVMRTFWHESRLCSRSWSRSCSWARSWPLPCSRSWSWLWPWSGSRSWLQSKASLVSLTDEQNTGK